MGAIMKDMKLSERLRFVREACGYKQWQLAEVLGVERSSYTYYETGKTEPSITSLITLADFYGISVDDLLRSSTLPPNLLR